MSEKTFDFQFHMTLTETEIERVMDGIRNVLNVQPPSLQRRDPLSDCVEKTKTRTYRKMVKETVTTDPNGNPLPFPIPTPVWVSYTCTVTETTTICPGHDSYTSTQEECFAD